VIRHVLITGLLAGSAGSCACGWPVQGGVLRLLDIAEMAPPAAGEDVEIVHGSATDMDAMEQACQGVDAVIHLAGYSREAPWRQILEVNIGGTYTVFEAARRRRVPRVIFASSAHATGYTPLPSDTELTESHYPRPDTNYGVGKVTGEAIGSLYADQYGMDVICVRIGVCFTSPGHPRMLGRWLSPDDCARLFDACLTVPAPGFRLVWGVSANTRGQFSLTQAHRLGYQPRDDSETLAARLIAEHGDPDPSDPPYTSSEARPEILGISGRGRYK
jgi:nucleoside-diphosphate-sugar epimerase